MALYALTKTTAIKRTSDQAFIPPDPANTDYAAFLDWLAAGNTPDPIPPVPINQSAQLAARIEFRARALERSGDILAAYALRNGL